MSTEPEPTPAEAQSITLRPSPLVVLVALAFAFCATPFAFGAPLFWLIYLVPVGMVVWAVRTRTVVAHDAITVSRVFGGRRLPWSDVTGLAVGARNRMSAVLADGSKVALPAVRPRHLSRMSVVSGGVLPDPSAES